ncbi:hypothetical protein KIN34_09605 [Cellulomonas sp. DKR-3]|uniref:ESX-1 secretion-associated protein EspA/EspE-like domain-containing protein n=1 Tax=Cellulomonas fulva TaxID=2835530 RepID=A0ABS5TZF2_9CELL|nr:hypothetical protein [Cellulomonas fulva]MBT0994540.1 hypothetical protein [Cellulomonas fulva]
MSVVVVEPEAWEAPAWFEGSALGLPVVGSLFSTGASLGSGDWAGALGSAAGSVGDLVGVAVDPLGTLASSVAGFLLDRFSWFQEALDVLVGDPAVVTAVGLTWANVGDTLAAQADRLIEIRDRTAQHWHGPAADAFRRRLTEMAERANVESFACRCVNVGFAIGSGIVEVVRQIVSAICAELVGKLIVWVAEALGTLGFGVPVVVAQATSAIARWVDDAARWTDELLGSTGRFCDLLADLYRSFDEVGLYNLGIGPDKVIGAGAAGVDQSADSGR